MFDEAYGIEKYVNQQKFWLNVYRKKLTLSVILNHTIFSCKILHRISFLIGLNLGKKSVKLSQF